MKVKYNIFRKWQRGWLDDFETSTLKDARRLIKLSIESGWPKKNHRLIKTEYRQTQIAV